MALSCRNNLIPGGAIDIGIDTGERQFEPVLADQAHDFPPGLGHRESILAPEDIRQ